MSAETLRNLRDKIAAAIKAGDTGRAEIIRHIASCSIADIAKLPPDMIVRLGPDGLAEVANRRADFAGLASAKPSPAPIITPDRWRRPGPMSVSALIAIMFVAGAVAADRIRPAVLKVFIDHSGLNDYGPLPPCTHLDQYSNHCIYVTGKDGTTTSDLLDHLAMSADELSHFNSSRALHKPLPRGTAFKIVRVNYPPF